jgi:hypothetical protein
MAAELVVEAELAVQVPTTCPVLAVLVVEPV